MRYNLLFMDDMIRESLLLMDDMIRESPLRGPTAQAQSTGLMLALRATSLREVRKKPPRISQGLFKRNWNF
jgi:hypothetical protein